MDINEINILRFKLENDIEELVSEFSNRTKATVNSIELEREKTVISFLDYRPIEVYRYGVDVDIYYDESRMDKAAE